MKSLIYFIISVLFCPLTFGIINKTKAIFAGRIGPPIFQTYFDIYKLLHKGAVYSKTTNGFIYLGPIISLSTMFIALLFIPFGKTPALLHFNGDIVLFIFILALARFFMILASLDTGSSFEGMGASRESLFSAFIEPALILVFLVFYKYTGELSLTNMFSKFDYSIWLNIGPSLILTTIALFIILLSENSRVPIDDPNTHLELTMIHEVIILDHGGFDLGLITISSGIKFFIFMSLIANVFMSLNFINISFLPFFVLIILISVVVGIIESVMARLKMQRVHQLLLAASILSILSLMLMYNR